MSVDVVLNFRAAEGNAEALRGLLEHGRNVSRQAEGCESFTLYQRRDDPNKFSCFERWTSIEAHHQNMAANIVATGHLAKILPLLDSPVDDGILDEID